MTELRFVPPSPAVQQAYARGADFLATLVVDGSADADNRLADPSYPTYAIAGAILVLNVPDNARHRQARDLLLRELRARQLTEERGWAPEDASYGGWGYFHAIPVKGATQSPMLSANLSATLFTIGALSLAGVPGDDPSLVKARAFVERCQNHPGDGGFFFSPAVPDSNKAGPVEGPDDNTSGFRSYGSMTADGLRALIRLGTRADHPRVQSAAAWLHRRYTPRRNPGDFPAHSAVRRESAFYYYSWSSAHALRALGARRIETDNGQLDWPQALAEELLARQRSDGSWSNPYTEMREDDPLLATAFAMASLAVAQSVLQGAYRSHGHEAAPVHPGE